MEDFKYTPLNLEKPAIRLLSLHPGNENAMISCDVFQAELHQRDNTISYEALSYTWGYPGFSKLIHVNGCGLNITRNLYYALRSLRYQDRQRVLWIDAVCIDQRNDKEKGHQVGQMWNIYKQADSVIFRLGLGSGWTDILMETLQRLQKESLQHACRAWSRRDHRWEDLWTCSFKPVLESHKATLWQLAGGLEEILKHPWFRRVWILQEVAFAKAGTISCGTKSVSARLFALAPVLLGVTPDAHCQSVLDIMPSPWRESTWWSESRSFHNLLFNFGNSEATDSRDLVYALRGMSSDLADKYDDPLFPDYKKSEEELVHDVIQYIYGSDVTYMWKEAPRLSSMRELASSLPRLETDICRYLAEMSQPDHMERILKRTEMLVTKDMIKVAAQYDKEGKVVNVLLRCRGRELKIDDEVLLCAAANLKAAKEVFEAFWCHQNQLIITAKVLIATAENKNSGHSAMQFLLSLKLEISCYYIARILEAVMGNQPEYAREDIIRLMLQQRCSNEKLIKEFITGVIEVQPHSLKVEIIQILLLSKLNNNDATSKVLTLAADMPFHGPGLLDQFVRLNPGFKISEDAVIAVVKDSWLGTNSFELLRRYFPSVNLSLKQVI
ncbi:heterokaryon incompatibility protein-domain-containing protein [Trichoderma sp. SZMC 28011]